MPVSHLGLTVSHISSATSFYLSALQPLGYRYVGQQGEAVGLGVDEADLFLCQAKNGLRVSPIHIAFSTKERTLVRDCYTAALDAGARPSGPPGYRNDDCSCFNAAVEDPDGHTIEFIFRAPAEASALRISEREVSRRQTKDTGRSHDGRRADRQSLDAYASKVQTRTRTALDLASATTSSMTKIDAPPRGINRSQTEPIGSTTGNGGKSFVGTLLGAAAAAAFTYAMAQSEPDNTRDEAVFKKSARSKEGRSRTSQEKSTTSKRPQRSRAISDRNCTFRTQSSQIIAGIEEPTYCDNRNSEVFTQHTTSRAKPHRSQTYDAVEYPSKSNSTRQSSRLGMKRASTLPIHIEELYSGSNGQSVPPNDSRHHIAEASGRKRHDSGVSIGSRGYNRLSWSESNPARPPRRGSVQDSAANVPLPPSKATSRASRSAAMNLRGVSYAQEGEDSDGLGDTKSIAPDDSISCVDFSKRNDDSRSRRSKDSAKTSRRSNSRHERIIRPTKPNERRNSMNTLPTRHRGDDYNGRSKRSAATYA